MSFPWNETLSTTAAVGSFVAAGIALRISSKANSTGAKGVEAAQYSNEAADKANEAAQKANETAEIVARIEQQRRHDELTPDLRITLVEQGGGSAQARLNVHLAGPHQLGHLDHLAITVDNDDMERRLLREDEQLTQADVDAHVWGPFHFVRGADGADEHGRSVPPVRLTVGRGRPFAMTRTVPGRWMTGKTFSMWQEEYRGQPVRLRITCRRGDEEWVLAQEVENPPLESGESGSQ